jgi:hypothetical protein
MQEVNDDEPMLLMDGYDDCVIGVCSRFGQPDIIAYDKELVLQKLMRDMSREDAEEFFEFNQLGAGMGEGTPCFVERSDIETIGQRV